MAGYVVPTVSSHNNIKYGERSNRVTELQNALIAQGYGIKADGIFGNKTLDALKQSQTKLGVVSDGIYGTNTMNAFNTFKPLSTTPTGVSTITPTVPTTGTGGVGTQPTITPPATEIANVTNLASTNQPFDYTPENDPLYTGALALQQSAIDEEMAARGISGSTISGERYAQVSAGLGLQYREQAYNIYKNERDSKLQQQEYDFNKKRMEKQDLLQSAEVRGYFKGEEARAWGVPDGTKTQSTLAREAQERQAKETAQYNKEMELIKAIQKAQDDANQKKIDDAKIAQAQHDKIYKATESSFQSKYTNDPVGAMMWLYGGSEATQALTSEDIYLITSQTRNNEGDPNSPWYYLDQALKKIATVEGTSTKGTTSGNIHGGGGASFGTSTKVRGYTK